MVLFFWYNFPISILDDQGKAHQLLFKKEMRIDKKIYASQRP